jgi:hypothetical protein
VQLVAVFMLANTAAKLVPIVVVVDEVVDVGMMMIGIVVVDVVVMTIGSDVVVDVVGVDVAGTVVVVVGVIVVVLVVAATLVVVVDTLGPTGPSDPHPSMAPMAIRTAAWRNVSLTIRSVSLP